jgi:hypothetical protein
MISGNACMPKQLDYARPQRNTRPLDFAVNLASSLQLFLFGLELAVILVTLKSSTTTGSTQNFDPWDLCWAIQWPGYGIASACTFVGSLSRLVDRRRLLYRVYVIAFPALVGVALIGYAADRIDGKDWEFFLVYPFAALIANPTLVVLSVRKLRGLRPLPDHQSALPADEYSDETLEQIAKAVRERSEHG